MKIKSYTKIVSLKKTKYYTAKFICNLHLFYYIIKNQKLQTRNTNTFPLNKLQIGCIENIRMRFFLVFKGLQNSFVFTYSVLSIAQQNFKSQHAYLYCIKTQVLKADNLSVLKCFAPLNGPIKKYKIPNEALVSSSCLGIFKIHDMFAVCIHKVSPYFLLNLQTITDSTQMLVPTNRN
jgi:surface polysaccharide O-acyltransferase-like enzyme